MIEYLYGEENFPSKICLGLKTSHTTFIMYFAFLGFLNLLTYVTI